MKLMKKTLLVVDEQGSSRLLPGLLLRPLGFTVFECTSAQEAIKLLPNTKPASILVALRLGEASGFDVLKHIRYDPIYRLIKVIAYIAPFDHFDEAGLIAQGFDGVLLQPIKSVDLVKILVI